MFDRKLRERAASEIEQYRNAMIDGLEARLGREVNIAVLLAALGSLAAQTLDAFPAESKDMIGNSWIDTVRSASNLDNGVTVGFGTRH